MTPSTQPLDHEHEHYMRKAFDVARQAKERGDHPFGCVLVGQGGEILMEQGNGFVGEGRDMTAHGERLMATRASKAYPPKCLAECTLYTSAEPCAMCSGAIYWGWHRAACLRADRARSEESNRGAWGKPDPQSAVSNGVGRWPTQRRSDRPIIGGRGRRASTRLLVELIHGTMKWRPVDGEDRPRVAAYGRSIKFPIPSVRRVVCKGHYATCALL
jgi:tRNA(Arg) A34 adenosine deaminase TadA